MMSTALILFAHGARDPEWAQPMRHIQSLLKAQQATAEVELAFLEFMKPTLAECVAERVLAGTTKICVIPMFIAQGGHLKRELPEIVDGLRTDYPTVDFVLTGPIGEQQAVMQAMAETALALAGL
ncbi:MAG: CbiX/SirB N-terminal domain-containing protein [Betaproteobacteria bacterium]|nr:CbiX/SirB N-terminal domain-containing protein [Betaproteobacteria bacterium]